MLCVARILNTSIYTFKKFDSRIYKKSLGSSATIYAASKAEKTRLRKWENEDEVERLM